MAKNAALQLDPPSSRRPRSSVHGLSPGSLAWKGLALAQRAESTRGPRVVAVYWDPHFQQAPADVAALDEFLRMLFHSSWMAKLSAYGMSPPRLVRSMVATEVPPSVLTRTGLEERLSQWLGSPAGSQKTRKSESLMYLVLTPCRTRLAFAASAAVPASARPNLHYTVVPLVSTTADILEQHSAAISHALMHGFVETLRRS